MSEEALDRDAMLDEAIRALNEGDVPALAALIDPDVTSHVGFELANSGTWHGIQQFGEMNRDWFEPWQEIRFELLSREMVGDQDTLARVRQHAIGAGSGVPVDLDVIFAIRLSEESGKVVLLGILGDDREAALAWLADPPAATE